MITFLTLLFGLVVGPRRVEVAVDPRVASVELRLDGATCATLRGAPWAAQCDFGAALRPRQLEAIARDAEGRELDRAVQRVNLPRGPAEATLRLLGDDDGDGYGYSAAELTWKAADESDPEEILVSLDGEPLPVEGRRVTLPPHDLRAVHVLSAELVFGKQVRARAEAAFGGEYGEEVRTELTAVPLELHDSRKLPSPAALQSWLRVAGLPARVVAVERSPREIVVVRDDASVRELRSLARSAGGSRSGQLSQLRMTAGVESKDTVRMVQTRPALIPTREGGWTALFPISENLNGRNTGLGWTVTHVFFRDAERETMDERVAEAVGIAGLHAAGSNRPRGVLLVRAGEPSPPLADGEIAPQTVRAYLRELRVPLFYWRVGPGKSGKEDPWGQPVTIRGWGGVHAAVAQVADALRPQFVAWIEGLHLPGQVELAADAPPGLRLAGAGEEARGGLEIARAPADALSR